LLKNYDQSQAEILEEYDASKRNTKASGGHSRRRDDYDEDEDGDEEGDEMPRGQGVQCAQQ